MAQMTVPGAGNDVEAQTRYLFHRYVHDLTRDSEGSLGCGDRGTTLNHRAFEEIFGPAESAQLGDLLDCLKRHAMSIQNDTRLQEELTKLKQHFNKETLWKLCQKVFSSLDDVWTAILTLFAFGLELCRQVALLLYDTIVDTITAAVTQWASAWLLKNGGWLAMVAGKDTWTAVVDTLSSWASWLKPSFGSTRQQAGTHSAPATGASTSTDGASTSKVD